MADDASMSRFYNDEMIPVASSNHTKLATASSADKNSYSDIQYYDTNVTNLAGYMSAGRWASGKRLEDWALHIGGPTETRLRSAAELLRHSNIPVAFPTETVYGLGADATRSQAVQGIYKAKGRPSDNPLIIHVADLKMLRNIMLPKGQVWNEGDQEIIPTIYLHLIDKFWPGPLTILLRNPARSKLAPEVTAGLPTFAVRMPDSPLALSLIKMVGVPLAAPSANRSTKPSPTSAKHVLYDLKSKIELVVDGGECNVGVESTVVDGMSFPPAILRPGGIDKEEIVKYGGKGWEDVVVAYKDQTEEAVKAPRAPGMKYKHYSPNARVILYEDTVKTIVSKTVDIERIASDNRVSNSSQASHYQNMAAQPYNILDAIDHGIPYLGFENQKFPLNIGFITTIKWPAFGHFEGPSARQLEQPCISFFLLDVKDDHTNENMSLAELWQGVRELPERKIANLYSLRLGNETKLIARGLFAALRTMDELKADVIYVEGIRDGKDGSAAVMNRLRKAATVVVHEG